MATAALAQLKARTRSLEHVCPRLCQGYESYTAALFRCLITNTGELKFTVKALMCCWGLFEKKATITEIDCLIHTPRASTHRLQHCKPLPSEGRLDDGQR
ncbi:inhibitor of Bruton tyrosine kinase [Platysternon megacephalum]|uniref:Inhibitor of Bruton tyrosine kinase n=1 Tax=Platysternon megacephalum TaxID=55544 RepID=A0A4D9EN35_9SAUR|nr:inhibitor of Bruton tyrosine kinase [Platysternon megacephalum]